MIDFLYTANYNAEGTPEETCLMHGRIFVLACKYLIPSLKNHVCQKIKGFSFNSGIREKGEAATKARDQAKANALLEAYSIAELPQE